MRRAWILALLLLSTPLIGCLGGADEGSEDDGLEKAKVTENTGGIEGIITNPAIEPIEGAEVTVKSLGETAETTQDGSFALSELPPATYTLTIEAEGYLGTEREVDVTASEVSTVDVVLTQEPSQNPYMSQREFAGFVECSAAAIVIAGAVCAIPNGLSFMGQEITNDNVTNDRFIFQFPIDPNPWQMTAEVQWEASNPLGARNSINVEPAGLPNDGKTEFGDGVGESPLIVTTDRKRFAEVDHNTTAVCEEEKDPESSISAPRDSYCNRDYIDEGGEVYVRMFVANTDTGQEAAGNDIVAPGVAFQQEYSLVVSMFHHAPACEDFSVFEDNLCEQPEVPPEEDPADGVGDE